MSWHRSDDAPTARSPTKFVMSHADRNETASVAISTQTFNTQSAANHIACGRVHAGWPFKLCALGGPCMLTSDLAFVLGTGLTEEFDVFFRVQLAELTGCLLQGHGETFLQPFQVLSLPFSQMLVGAQPT